MVDLPTVPDRIVTSTAPTSSVSRSDIIGSTNLMAKAIGDVADATMDIATKQAKEQAGTDLQNQKVTLNADGSVSVANPANSLIFGRAGEAYHAAVAAGTIAQHGNAISTEMNDLHQKYPTDPAAFTAAANAWKTSYLEQHGGGQIGQAISQQADQVQTQHALSITNAAGANDLKQQDSSLSASQTSARDDVMAMLRGGADIKDKAVQGRIAQYDATTEARATNPLFGYSQEQAKLDRDTFHSEAAGSRMLYNVDKIYKDQGPSGGKANAVKAAEDILTNPDYKLSQAQREQFYHRAVGEIRANEAIRKQDIGEARAAFSELTLASAAGARIDSDQVEQVAGAFRAAGDPGSAARVYSSFIRKPLNDDFGRQPLAVQTQQLTALRGAGTFNKSIPIEGRQLLDHIAATEGRYDSLYGGQPFRDFGDHPRQSQTITSGPDTGKTTTAAGRYQFLASTWDQQKAKLGLTDFSPANQDTAAWDLAQTEYKAKTGKDLMTVLRSGDAAAIGDVPRQLSGQWSSLPGGRQPAAGRGVMPMGPAGSAWLAANRSRELDDAASAQWKTVMTDYTKEGTRPSLKTVNDVVTAARATGNADLLDTIAHDAERMDISGQFARASLPEQHAQLTAMSAAGEAGALPPGTAALQKDMQRRSDAVTSGLKDNPIATTVTNFGEKFKPVAPLDFSSDDNLAAGLKQRAQIAQFARQNWETPGALSALDAPDVAQVQGMLANPDPAVKGKIFNALSSLPEDVRNATLAKIGDNRPELMVSVAAGSMMKAAPDIAGSIIRGQQAIALDKGYLPSGPEGKAFDQKLDEHIPASTFSLAGRTDASGPYSVVQGLVKARYADLSAQMSDTAGKLNKTRLEQAVNDVTGGILDHNGSKLIAPVRGMPQATFDQVMYGITDADLGNAPVASNLAAANAALNLTPQEQALYQRHVTNLTGAGGVTNENGSRSTLFQSSVEHDGKTYNIPTVWDGKILPIGEALARVQVEGWDKFPSYGSEAEAEARYQKMHAFMEKDTAQYNRGNPAAVTTQAGQPITADYLRNSATLESVGDGRYFVKLGKDPMRPVYAYQGANSEAPQKFILDLRNRPLGTVPPPIPSAMP